MAFTITDGDYYVSKKGNDANDGLTPATAKLTINGACSVVTSGQKIVVGSGMYVESIPARTSIAYNIHGDGEVIIDQAGVLSSPGILFGGDGNTIRNITIRNFTSLARATSSIYSGDWYDCRFINNTRPFSIFKTGSVYNCLFVDCDITVNTGNSSHRYFYYCTVVNSKLWAYTNSIFNMYHCDVDANSAVATGQQTGGDYYHCNVRGLIGSLQYNGVLAYEAVQPTKVTNCIEVDPLFNSKAPLDVSLSLNSPNRYASNIGNYIGYAREAQSLNNSDAAFDSASGATVTGTLGAGSVVKVGTSYELAVGATEATIETGIIETSGFDSRVLERIRVEGLEVPRFEVFDDTNAGTDLANQRTFEMKWAGELELTAPPTMGAYYKMIWNRKPQIDTVNNVGNADPLFDPLNAEDIKTKFVQLKVTMRNDGVS